MSEHSEEPWGLYIDKINGDPLGRNKASIVALGITICEMYYPVGGVYGDVAEKNARRIVACVNAASGVADETLAKIEANGGISGMLSRGAINAVHDAEVTEQRDELLAVLKDLELSANTIAFCYERRPENFAAALSSLQASAEASRAIIAKIEGQS